MVGDIIYTCVPHSARIPPPLAAPPPCSAYLHLLRTFESSVNNTGYLGKKILQYLAIQIFRFHFVVTALLFARM